jgi:hypothetical protein
MHGACGDHHFVGDGYSSIGGKDLTLLLFPHVDNKGEAQVNARLEIGHIVIQIRLADLSVGGEDVHDKGAKINGVESFGGVLKYGLVDVVNCRHILVACDVDNHLVDVQCFECSGVGGTQFLAFCCCGANWDNWVGWRFIWWNVESLSLGSQVDGWILK